MTARPRFSRQAGRRIFRQRGISLVEMAIVAAIGVIIVALSIQGVQKLLADNKASAELSTLPTIVSNVQKVYANQADYTGVTQTVLINASVFPTQYVSGTNLIDRWNGSITAAAVTLNGVANAGVSLTYTSVPSQECSDIAGNLDAVMSTVTVNGASTKAYGAVSSNATISTQCATGNNTIVFTFGK